MEERLRNINVSPAVVGGVVVDLTATTASVGVLWCYDYCGVLGAFFLFWWAMCLTAERAIIRHRASTSLVTLRLHGYRLRPVP